MRPRGAAAVLKDTPRLADARHGFTVTERRRSIPRPALLRPVRLWQSRFDGHRGIAFVSPQSRACRRPGEGRLGSRHYKTTGRSVSVGRCSGRVDYVEMTSDASGYQMLWQLAFLHLK